MSVHLRTIVTVYCDGGTHQGLEFSSERPLTEALEYIRRAGWTIKRDGRTLCAQHAKDAS